MAKYKVNLLDGSKANVELKDREGVRRLFQNNGFWDGDTFYAAGAIHSIEPLRIEDRFGKPVAEEDGE
jgi:hypothetical protein